MRVIKLDSNNTVIEVKNVSQDYTITENEIISNMGEMGQIMQEDGSFITTNNEPMPETTLEDKINYIYYKQMGVIA